MVIQHLVIESISYSNRFSQFTVGAGGAKGTTPNPGRALELLTEMEQTEAPSIFSTITSTGGGARYGYRYTSTQCGPPAPAKAPGGGAGGGAGSWINNGTAWNR